MISICSWSGRLIFWGAPGLQQTHAHALFWKDTWKHTSLLHLVAAMDCINEEATHTRHWTVLGDRHGSWSLIHIAQIGQQVLDQCKYVEGAEGRYTDRAQSPLYWALATGHVRLERTCIPCVMRCVWERSGSGRIHGTNTWPFTYHIMYVWL